MRILLYEFVTGGGWYSHGTGDPPSSLVIEGRAMRQALAADFAALDGVRLDVLCDRRFGMDASLPTAATLHDIDGAARERELLGSIARDADWTILIAPEFGGHLAERCRWIEQAGGRLLGAHAELALLAGDKHAMARHLAAHGVAVPWGVAIDAGAVLPQDFPYPAVLKPRDGCGSLGIERIDGGSQDRTAAWPARMERLRPGLAASVAVLCGPAGQVPLTPCRQWLGGESGFAYQGGELPLEPSLAARATQLALAAIGTLRSPVGFWGVDMVLGTDNRGSGDVVIEVNPRLTTSYVGLRALSQVNLAGAMLATAEGARVQLSWRNEAIEFDARGVVRPALRKTCG